MTNNDFIELCKDKVLDYYKKDLKKDISRKDIYVMWICKTLQNNKALLSTNILDTRYFEITYNGDKKELYFDAYIKEKNEKFSY